MAKVLQPPRPFIYPLPVALVTCQEPGGGPNVVTASWISPVCAQPPLLGVSLRPHRYTTPIIQETGEFGVSVPSHGIAYEVDLCGTLSGRDAEKIRVSGLTETPAIKIAAPLIAECGVCMECVVRQSLQLGSHTLFIGEVVALHIEEDLLSRVEDSDEDRLLEITRAKPLLYAPDTHEYWVLGDLALRHGPSSGRKP